MMIDFKDFDDAHDFQPLFERAKNADARNFVLDFSHEKARCVFDIDEGDLKALLETERQPQYTTRWINIWAPDRQTKIIDHIAAVYGFSPRLKGLMKSKHVLRGPSSKRPQRPGSSHKTSPSSSTTSKGSNSIELKPVDVEKQSVRQDNTEGDLMRDLNHYDIVSSIYHYTSVDLGVKYFCIGYNMLHNVKPDRQSAHTQPGYGDSKLPNGDRIWNWLILCDDKTVISMFEDPYTSLSAPIRPTHDATPTRHNLLNVFSQLSNVAYSPDRNPISLVPIRHTEATLDEPASPSSSNPSSSQIAEPGPAEVDGPGLLFYYLFDDWWTTYALLTRHEHHYGAELNRLRDEMVEHPRVDHVYSLQHIGRQLACLKRLYESYETVILRVLEKQRMPLALSQLASEQHSAEPGISRAATGSEGTQGQESLWSRPVCVPARMYHAQPQFGTWGHGTGSYDQYGVYLTSATRIRLERLRDRVRLYALAEIAESIDLKDSLVTMNYNLIAVKEAASMERLTRVTTLLSKATILFLPVSLLSAYFSIEWDEPEGETVKAYWVSFAVIFGVTFVLLIVFGAVSRTLEGAVLYQPLWRVVGKGIREAKSAKKEVEGRLGAKGYDHED